MINNIKVKLIAHTPNPDNIVASAAKLCYSQVGIDKIQENLSQKETQRFLNTLIDIGHLSPIEHVSFTFAIEGISRSCSHQIVRHRIASFSQQSQRYVKLNQFEYIVPPEIYGIDEAKEIYIEAMKQDQIAYEKLVNILYEKHLKTNLHKNQSEKKAHANAEKKAIEDARYVFPNACETKMIFTVNARSLINFFNHRCCERAQWECDTFVYNEVV